MIKSILERVIHLRAAYVDEALRIKSQQPDWFASKDIRSTILGRSASCITDAASGLINAAGYMMKPEWWMHHFHTSPPPNVCRNYAQRHEGFIKLAFVLVFFSGIESSIRQITRTIHPGKYCNSTTSFYSIYKPLLTDLKMQDFVSSLDLFREIRNACHNNGVYFNAKGDRILEYKGCRYHFQNGKKLDFVSWNLILDLVENTFDMIVKIISHPDIERLDHIEDPYFDNELEET